MDETIRAYDTIAEDYANTHSKNMWTHEFDELKLLVNGLELLEIGCGAGRDAAYLNKIGFKYVGIDASSKMLEIARKKVKAKFRRMSFYDLKFRSESFDAVVAMASLLHAQKKKIGKVLKNSFA